MIIFMKIKIFILDISIKKELEFIVKLIKINRAGEET